MEIKNMKANTKALFMLFIILLMLSRGCSNGSNEVSLSARNPDDILILKWIVPDDIVLPNIDFIDNLLAKRDIPYGIEFVQLPEATFREEVIKAKAEELEADIISSGLVLTIDYWNPYFDFVKEEVYYPLDNYLYSELGQKLVSTYDEKIWKAFQIEGSIYAISSNSYTPNKNVIIYKESITKKNGFIADQFKLPLWDWEHFLDDFSKGKENYQAIIELPFFPFLVEYTTTGAIPWLYIDETAGNAEVFNIFDREYGAKLWNTIRDFQNKGYVQTLTQFNNNDSMELPIIKFEKFTCNEFFSEFKNQFYQGYSCVKLSDDYATNEMCNIHFGIASWSKQPDIAFELLATIMTDAELSNAFVYGEFDRDYTISKGRAVEIGTTDGWKNPNWGFGNRHLTHPTLNETKSKTDDLKKALDEAPPSRLLGFHFDYTSVKEEIDAVSSVYYDVFYGMDPYSMDILEINQKFKYAGIDEVIAEYNRQLAEWTK